jgi:ribulose-phosphate 3-epimerase
MKSGVSINPHTPVELLNDILFEADLVLIMSVNPGFGGQKFIENSLSRISRLRKLIDQKGLSTLIEVDGGVDVNNAASIYSAGADVLVAGNAVFKSENPLEAIRTIKGL